MLLHLSKFSSVERMFLSVASLKVSKICRNALYSLSVALIQSSVHRYSFESVLLKLDFVLSVFLPFDFVLSLVTFCLSSPMSMSLLVSAVTSERCLFLE